MGSRASCAAPRARDGLDGNRGADARVERWGLHVEECGSGNAVVLIHGLVASARFWRPVCAHLSGRFACIAPDLLGFGRSPWPDIAYSVDDHVDALARSVLVQHKAPVVLVGHSTGAVFAIELAARFPQAVSRLVLFSPPWFPSGDDALYHVRRLGVWARLLVDAPRISCVLCHLICQRRRFWRHVLPRLMRDLPREIVEDGMMHSYASVARTFRSCIVEHRVEAALARVREHGIHVTVIHPSADDVVARDSLRALAQRFGLELQEVDGEHLFPLRHADVAAQQIAGARET